MKLPANPEEVGNSETAQDIEMCNSTVKTGKEADSAPPPHSPSEGEASEGTITEYFSANGRRRTGRNTSEKEKHGRTQRLDKEKRVSNKTLKAQKAAAKRAKEERPFKSASLK